MDCVCIASVALFWLREEFGTPSGFEILLGEGGDVELGARTSKHIFLFAFDQLTLNSLSLSLSLSLLFVPCIYSYCSFIYYMLGLFVCASLVLNHESFI